MPIRAGPIVVCTKHIWAVVKARISLSGCSSLSGHLAIFGNGKNLSEGSLPERTTRGSPATRRVVSDGSERTKNAIRTQTR